MKKIWDKRGYHWYSKKELGKLYWNKKHPDYLRDRLNEKGMKKLRKMDYKCPCKTERQIVLMSRGQMLVRAILKPWRWKLSITWKDNVAPTQFYLNERREGGRFVLERTPYRAHLER